MMVAIARWRIPHTEHRVRATWRWWWSKRWRKWLTILGILMIVLPVGSIELTSQNWFCNSCHIMNSYYHSWQIGSHKDVDCVTCHIPPGPNSYFWAKLNGLGQVVDDLLERTSTKPSASVSDFSCTRGGCHNLEHVKSISRKEGKFFFNHNKHLNLEYLGIDLHCTTCHSHVQGSKHFEVNTSVCITCHLITPGAAAPALELAAMTSTRPSTDAATTQPISTRPTMDSAEWQPIIASSLLPQGKTPPQHCKNCHDAPAKSLEYRGLKVVHEEYLSYGAACESCHRNVTAKPEKMDSDHCFSCHDFGIEKMTTVPELHRQHTTGRHKVECFSCHGVIRHGPSAQIMHLDQVDCQACHKQQHMIQRGTYKSTTELAHIPDDPSALSPMFLVHVDCTGCHMQQQNLSIKPQSGATVAKASSNACDRCHKPGLGQTMIPMWQKNTRDLYDSVAKMVPTSAGSPQAQQWTAEAKRLLDIVRMDGSWGVHNPRYTQKLLEQARMKLLQVQESAKPQEGAGK